MKQLVRTVQIVFIALAISMAGSRSATMGQSGDDDDVAYSIIINRANYKRGSKAILQIILVNRGSSLFVSRDIGRCGKWSGYSEIGLFNEKGENVLHGGCDITEKTILDSDLKQALNDSGLWIHLLPGEIYGTEEELVLPTTPGVYHFRGELLPPGFPSPQKKLLAEQGLRVLHRRHIAPPVEIKIE